MVGLHFFSYILLYNTVVNVVASSKLKNDSCCSYPCMNNGICYSSKAEVYICDCTGTGYYGGNCESVYWSTIMAKWFNPSTHMLTYMLSNFQPFWMFVNKIGYLQRSWMVTVLNVLVAKVQEPSLYTSQPYTTFESYMNLSTYVRILPAIPDNCATAMGNKGKKKLSNPQNLIDAFFLRRKFTACPVKTSLAFVHFALHFSMQFIKSNLTLGMPHQWGTQIIDISNVYGQEKSRQLQLRMKKNGKLKYSLINGEVFPPFFNETGVFMHGIDHTPEGYKFTFGHPGFNVVPFTIFFATLWLREHNRVCDELKLEHPSWDDERLYQTARLIITAETIKIAIVDYLQHLSGFHYQLLYDPILLHQKSFSYHNQIHVEIDLLHHWFSLLPDHIMLKDHMYSIRKLIFNPKPMVNLGMKKMTIELSNQLAGAGAGGKNHGFETLAFSKKAILDGRRLRLQPFNKYRIKFGLEPYESFEDLTGDIKMAADLKRHYGDVDAVEFVVGLVVEKRRTTHMFGETLTEIVVSHLLKALYSNPIGSPQMWRPSTFGGKKGFKIIDETTLQELVCRNVKDCPKISFTAPIEQPNIESCLMRSEPKCDLKSSSEALLRLFMGASYDENYSLTKVPPLRGGDELEPKPMEAMKPNLNKPTPTEFMDSCDAPEEVEECEPLQQATTTAAPSTQPQDRNEC